jgi:hypothetical protein
VTGIAADGACISAVQMLSYQTPARCACDLYFDGYNYFGEHSEVAIDWFNSHTS